MRRETFTSWFTAGLIVWPPILLVVALVAAGWTTLLPAAVVAYVIVLAVLDPFGRR